MNCKCGNKLQWEDGAFCKECMAEADERVRRQSDYGLFNGLSK